jgi:CheY-like chemotaxis protein
VKFTDRGEVVATTQRSPEPASRPGSCRLRFSVRDTGIGIPREKQVELFEAFTQLDASVARTRGGTGLGLTISKRIVDLMNGRLRVESQPGEGSTFSFDVELRTAQTGVPCQVPPPADLAGRRALVLDDNATNREFLMQALASRGVEVMQVSRCRDAVEELLAAARAGRPFDVALLDLHLPDGDGFSVLEEVRPDLPTGALAVVMFASEDVAGGARRARELGVGAYLLKPVRLSTLAETVAGVVGARLAVVPGAAASPAPERPLAPVLPEGLRVLLAEDNPVNQTFVTAILATAKASVTTAPDGQGALHALGEREFDVVLMDVQMPGMDGYEATRRLRAQGLRIPVIGLTAHAMKGDRERCLDAGMDDYLTKPVSREALLRKVAAWVRGCPGVCPGEEPEPPADLEGLRRGLGGNFTVLGALTDQLRASSDELLPEIERAVRERDPDRLQCAAHKLRGGLLVFGAKEAAVLAEELDHVGREGRTEEGEALAEELRAEVQRLLAYLEANARS